MVKYQPYRDEPFQRDCQERYQPIKELAAMYNRPFSVLDIGANYGWFGQQLVRDFPNCVYFGVDNKVIDPHERIWHINRHHTGTTYLALSSCEQFDIVLGLAVLHHIPDYREAYVGMRQLGQFTVFEIPGEGEKGAAGEDRQEGIRELFQSYTPIATFDSHVDGTKRPMYVVENKPFIKTQSLDALVRGAPTYAKYYLFWDFDEAKICIDRRDGYIGRPKDCPPIELRDYIPGMNAHNFRILGGKVDFEPSEDHPDPTPWNYVLSDSIRPIDTFHEKDRGAG